MLECLLPLLVMLGQMYILRMCVTFIRHSYDGSDIQC